MTITAKAKSLLVVLKEKAALNCLVELANSGWFE
jgi:hypothetical protein